jgi:kinesin family protein C2/C3
VFAPNDSQEAVYEDVSDLIVSVADGYNVCIMAYGQTGSGKTYTMQGESSNPGINMRALKELFQIGEDRKESVRMQVQASIVEIYNESIFDLLSDSPRHTGDRLDIKEVGCGVLCTLSCISSCWLHYLCPGGLIDIKEVGCALI